MDAVAEEAARGGEVMGGAVGAVGGAVGGLLRAVEDGGLAVAGGVASAGAALSGAVGVGGGNGGIGSHGDAAAAAAAAAAMIAPATLAQQASCSHLLWVISRAAFRAIALRSSHRELLLALKRVPILLGLSDVRLGRLAETLSEVRFAAVPMMSCRHRSAAT